MPDSNSFNRVLRRIHVEPGFVLPENPQASARFREQFNAKSQSMHMGITWRNDNSNPLIADGFELQLDGQAWTRYKTRSNGSTRLFINRRSLRQDVAKIFSEVEMERQNKVIDAYNSVGWTDADLSAAFQTLTPDEQHAVVLFRDKVKPLIDRIYARQQDPNSEIYEDYVMVHGSAEARQIIARSHVDGPVGLTYLGDSTFSLLPWFPEPPAINGMIDPRLTLEDVKQLGANLSSDADQLRPTTVLQLQIDAEGNREVTSIALPRHPDFIADHQALAAALDEIASLNLDDLQKRQLSAWAKYFRTGSAEDEAVAAQATIDATTSTSRLRVHLGPSESYWDDNLKFPYLLQVGVVSGESAAQLQALAAAFPGIEQSLAEIENYKPRKLVATKDGFATPMQQLVVGGFIGAFAIDPAGNNFPNYTYPNVEGASRFVLVEAIAGSYARADMAVQMQTLNELFAANDQPTSWGVTYLDDIHSFVTEHESGHLLGPQRSHITPSQAQMGAVFGAHWGDADEAKADLTFAADLKIKYNVGQVDLNEVIKAERIFLLRLTSPLYAGKTKMAEGKLSSHRFGIVLALGYYFKTGCLALDENQKIKIDYERMLEVSDELWRKIIQFQANGDVDGFMQFAKEAATYIPDSVDAGILQANKSAKRGILKRHFE